MTKILLVEDDKSLREIYGVRLLAEGYDIVSAGDGEEALAMAIKEKPTLIISDVMMPKISGFDMLDILRSTTETRDIKVIMMTALSSDDQRSRGEQLGADRYLVKSQVGIEDVVRTVHEVLSDNTAGAAASVTAPVAAAATAEPAATPVAEPVSDTTPDPAPAAEPTSAPVVDTPSVADPASEPAPSPDRYTDNNLSDTPTGTASAPGNDAAGPLPPQPSETEAESTLPEPTAPFTSPRPTNLGERVIQPLSDDLNQPEGEGNVSEQIEQELQASAEPVTSTQVDEAISDNEVEPVTTPIEASPEPVGFDPSTAPASDLAPTDAPVQDPSAPQSEEKPTITGVSGSSL